MQAKFLEKSKSIVSSKTEKFCELTKGRKNSGYSFGLELDNYKISVMKEQKAKTN